ncbi:MAG: hypothetical protein ACPGYJ_11365, partial [bacterium]
MDWDDGDITNEQVREALAATSMNLDPTQREELFGKGKSCSSVVHPSLGTSKESKPTVTNSKVPDPDIAIASAEIDRVISSTPNIRPVALKHKKTFRPAALKLQILDQYNPLVKLRERARTTSERLQVEVEIQKLCDEYCINQKSLAATMHKWNNNIIKLKQTVMEGGHGAKSQRKKRKTDHFGPRKHKLKKGTGSKKDGAVLGDHEGPVSASLASELDGLVDYLRSDSVLKLVDAEKNGIGMNINGATAIDLNISGGKSKSHLGKLLSAVKTTESGDPPAFSEEAIVKLVTTELHQINA